MMYLRAGRTDLAHGRSNMRKPRDFVVAKGALVEEESDKREILHSGQWEWKNQVQDRSIIL
jgi:hypothetical protein